MFPVAFSTLSEVLPIRKNKCIAVAGIILLLFTVLSITFLGDDDISPLRMHLMGDRIQEATFSETVHYKINVINVMGQDRKVKLELINIPKNWNASLNDDYFNLAPNSNKIVVLSVTAPSVNASGDRGLSTVAAIGVRSEYNGSIGTITILKGSAMKFNEGKLSEMRSSNDINSTDIIITRGKSSIDIEWSEFYNGDYDGDTTLILQDARVGFLYHDNKVYIPVESGNITFFGEGFGGNGDNISSGVTILSRSIKVIDDEFPGLTYNSVIVLDPSEISDTVQTNDSLLTLSVVEVGPETGLSLEVLEGEVNLENEVDSHTLKKAKKVTVTQEENIPDPRNISRSVIVVESDDCVEASVTSDGKNILDYENTRHIKVGSKEIFIFDSYLLEVELELTGKGDGDYTVEFSTMKNNVVRSFELNTTASLDTADNFVYREDRLELKNMEQDKFFDIEITEHDLTSGEEHNFTAINVETTEKDMGFTVTDWKSLDDKEKTPVTFNLGEDEIGIHTGMTGEEIMNLFHITHETEQTRLWLWILPFPFMGLLAFGGHRYYLAAAVFRDVLIESLSIDPVEPIAGKPAVFTASIKNKGAAIKGSKYVLSVSFYNNFVGMGKEILDIQNQKFEHNEIRDVSIQWIPDLSGPHMMNVSLDVDDSEVDGKRMEVSVQDKFQRAV